MTPEEITALQAENARLKATNTELDGNYKTITSKLGGRSIDSVIADAIALGDVVKQRDELMTEKAKNGGQADVDALVEQKTGAVRQEFGTKLEEKDKTIQSLAGQVKEMKVVDEAVKRVGDSLYKGAAEDFRAYVRANCSLNDNGDIVVIDANGKPRYSPANPSNLMTLDELIGDLKKARDHWWTSRLLPGGHDPSKGGGGSASVAVSSYAELKKLDGKGAGEALSKMTADQRGAILREAIAAGDMKFITG